MKFNTPYNISKQTLRNEFVDNTLVTDATSGDDNEQLYYRIKNGEIVSPFKNGYYEADSEEIPEDTPMDNFDDMDITEIQTLLRENEEKMKIYQDELSKKQKKEEEIKAEREKKLEDLLSETPNEDTK